MTTALSIENGSLIEGENIMADLNIPVGQDPAVAPLTRTDDQIFPLSKTPTSSGLLRHPPRFRLSTFSNFGTPCALTHLLGSPPSSDTVIEYVNTLGYLSTLKNVSAMSVNALYQPWRAILSMINMCLTGKTAGFDRPRHPVLQMLWGIINHSNIDYAERIWEEFVQSIQTFLTDRKNLATAARGKKKTAHLLIPSVRFTKLIIHHLRTKHNIHLRTGSPLHCSHEESILNTLRFVRKDGREIFGMPIPDALLTDKIKGPHYYGDYQEHVAKYQQFLDEERGKAEKGGATESSEATKVTKHKAAKATKPAGDKAPKPTATQPPKPKPAPTQPSKVVSKKKRKLVKEIPDEPSAAKRSKGGLVTKKRKPKSPLKLVDEPSNKGVPVEEPAYNEEDADLERALELSLMEQGAQTQGPARLVVIREPESGRIQLLPERRPLMPTESSAHVESPSMDAELNLTDSETESDVEASKINAGSQDEDQAGPNLEHMDLETTDALTQHKLEQMDEGFTTTAYLNVQENLKLPTEDQFFVEKPHEENSEKTNAETEVQSMVPVPIIQDTSSVPPMTTLVIDLTTMQSDSPLPTSTATTLIITTTTTIPPTPQPQQSTTDSILVHRIGELEQHMADQLQDNLALGERLDKYGTRLYNFENLNIPHKLHYELASGICPLQQRMFEDDSYKANNVHKDLYEALQKSLELDYSNQCLADQEEARKKRRKRRDAPRSPRGSPPSQPPPPPPPAGASGAPGTSGASGSSQLPPPPPPPSTGTSGSTLQQGRKAPSSSKTTASAQQSMAWTTSNTRYESTGIVGVQELSPSDDLMHHDSAPDEQVQVSDDQDSGNDHTPATADSRKDWWKPLPEEERPATPEPAWTIPFSHKSDLENNWTSALATTYEPPAKNSLLAKIGDITTFLNSYCQRMNKTVLTQADFEGQAYEVVKSFYPDVIQLQFQMEECHKMLTEQVDWANPEGDQVRINVNRPLPLGGPPGHVTIQTEFFFNKDLEYLRYGSKGSCPALSISKIKAASYPDFGLELLVPEQMWIDDVCIYDVSAKYGISHWWFTRQKFYIDRHDSPSCQKEVRTHMRILSVVRIKAYSGYGYDYLSEIVLRRADHQEHKIAEKDFKNLYPSDFEDLNLLLLQGHLDHLSGSDKRMLSTAVKLWTRNLVIRQRVEDFQLGIESYQTQLNLTKPGWDATGYEFKHDYTIIESPRAVIFPVNNNERKIMRFNEIYKFSDGTLTRILETLDYRVKEFKIKRLNPGMNTRFWTEKDVTRSKEFITAIERRLKTRRIYRNLECFVGGRVRDIDYRLLQRTE
ncbi:monodehydroascorbate reductase [Tanacetum coccineum]